MKYNKNIKKKITLEEINLAARYLERKKAKLERANGEFRLDKERRLTNKLDRKLTKQKDEIKEEAKELSFFKSFSSKVRIINKQTSEEEIDQFLRDLPEQEDIVDDIVSIGGLVYNKGAEDSHEQIGMDGDGVNFDLVNPHALQYIRDKRSLHLSERRGSIKKTTKDKVKKIILNGALEGESYQQVAKKIEEQGEAGVFSRDRAELIATNQVGQAYGTGNHKMVEVYTSRTNNQVEKHWRTVNDENVTDRCLENQAEGWIPFRSKYPSGDNAAPRHSNPRCRCANGYRRKN